ncbi:unnamed protein product [Caenorhabditis bovis]|uniref:Serpentine Receptor, class T n=1 Tax=Caenorhabditis bovis TaxID=2654633 RepID=A0A8S1F7N5_9PELO|nr:unnamed protein product [Caenorhabditis bovis]
MALFRKLMANDVECSLSGFIVNGFQVHPYYYNCSTISDPFAIGEKRPFLGIYFIASGLILMTTYIPCLIVIACSDLMRSSCYKIMMYLGFVDLVCIMVNSLATGYLGFVGATFCSYPRAIFVFGSLGCGGWIGACATCILLAVNRCCDINHRIPFREMFRGNTVFILMVIPLVITVYAVFFTKPVLFNSNYMSWFFTPFTGLELESYVNLAHTTTNCVVSLATTSIYVYLCLFIRHSARHSHSEALSKTQKQVLVQSSIICSFNAIAAYIYVYMQFFPAPPLVILIGQIAWQWSHGSVGIVYITMNKTIRRKVIDLIIPHFIRQRLHIGTFEVISQKTAVSSVRKIATTSGSSNF